MSAYNADPSKCLHCANARECGGEFCVDHMPRTAELATNPDNSRAELLTVGAVIVSADVPLSLTEAADLLREAGWVPVGTWGVIEGTGRCVIEVQATDGRLAAR